MENLKKWDGKCNGYQYDAESISEWSMTIDEKGTIWYIPHDGKNQLAIWCPAESLYRHLHRLYQIGVSCVTRTK